VRRKRKGEGSTEKESKRGEGREREARSYLKARVSLWEKENDYCADGE